MSDERPEALLKSALEKIIYFEARSEALHNDLATARDESSRLKAELAQASQRELEVRRQLAQTEVQLSRSHREREELGRMNDALRGERSALIEKFIEANRIHQSDGDASDGGFDLASFIALLRSEAMGQPPREPKVPESYAFQEDAPRLVPPPAVSAPPTSAAVGHAERLRAEGRLDVQDAQLTALSAHRPSMPGRTEETLFGFSLRELSAPDPAGRTRAAERLKALGQSAAAPALATALHHETESRVLVALLTAFAELAGKEGVAVVAPHLTSTNPDVRIGALKALLALDATQAAPHLSAAMKDPDAAVRRRATLLALGLTAEAALKLGREAISDGDPEVRAVGALALGAAGGEAARGPLLRALDDPEEKVRAAAAKSVSRVLGEDVSAVVKLAESQRRREIRRLAALPARVFVSGARLTLKEKLAAAAAKQGAQSAGVELAPTHASAPVHAPTHASAPVHVSAAVHAPALVAVGVRAASASAVPSSMQGPARPSLAGPSSVTSLLAESSPRPPPLAVRPPAATARPADSSEPPRALLSAVLTELRRSLRGKTLPDLSAQVGKSAPEVERACAALTSRGDVVRRGIKYFVA
ncbi:MAG: HEAT repeat domain-containing protein [Myxococcota bacterium]|nr:HEAT repeat domain-containing protein [Myxococcota bacterium]